MKTLKEILAEGDMGRYLQHLAGCVHDIMPSRDGKSDNRCYFILVVGDGTGHTEITANIHKDCWTDILAAVALCLHEEGVGMRPEVAAAAKGDATGDAAKKGGPGHRITVRRGDLFGDGGKK